MSRDLSSAAPRWRCITPGVWLREPPPGGVAALVCSPRPGVYVGTIRVLNGAELHRTAEHATNEDAARELARMAGVTKHAGDAGISVDLRATGDAWTLHYRTGSTPGRSPLDAVAHALRIARWHADNERVLREREGR